MFLCLTYLLFYILLVSVPVPLSILSAPLSTSAIPAPVPIPESSAPLSAFAIPRVICSFVLCLCLSS